MPKLSLTPFNRFLRNPNQHSYFGSEQYKKEDNKLMAQVKLLVDPQTKRELLLVGTLNSSNVLAQRTQKLIDEFEPDSVLVQTTPQWYKGINHELRREPKTNYDVFQHSAKYANPTPKIDNNTRGLIFKYRLYTWKATMKFLIALPATRSDPFSPGLEVYKAIDYATKNKKKVYYAGGMFNDQVISALHQEKRMDIIFLLRRYFTSMSNSFWKNEARDIWSLMSVHSFGGFTEHVDDYLISWFVNYFEKLAPHQKRIIIDMVSEDLFRTIYKDMDGQKLFALVNHWHMPAVEHMWRLKTGTHELEEFINPIGDFDINGIQEATVVNDYLRRLRSKNAKSEPSHTGDYITHYHKIALEAERERHVFFNGYNDPELEHGLYNDENKGVKDLPYKLHEHH